LYIDLKFIQDFVPAEIYNLEVYIPITHLIGSMKTIMVEYDEQSYTENSDNEDDSML